MNRACIASVVASAILRPSDGSLPISAEILDTGLRNKLQSNLPNRPTRFPAEHAQMKMSALLGQSVSGLQERFRP